MYKRQFVHIAGKRYADRTESTTTVTVYSNQPSVALYVNGELKEMQTGEKVFRFRVPMSEKTMLKAVAGPCTDTADLRKVSQPNPDYRLHKTHSTSANWV